MIDNEHRVRRMRPLCAFLVSGLATAALVPACSDTEDEEDAYSGAYYYPADIATSDMYYADSWATDPYAFRIRKPQLSGDAGASGVGGAGGDGNAGAPGSDGRIAVTDPGAAIRALAKGQDVCPGQVTVSETQTRVTCASSAGTGMIRTGAEVEFTNCVLENGGTLNGSLAVSGTHTASDDECDDDTVIEVTYTSTITGLSYVAPSDRRIDIPSWSNTGSYSRSVGGPPTNLVVTGSGAVKRFDSDGDLIADLTVAGTHNYAFGSDDDGSFYTVSGTISAQDTVRDGQATVIGDGVTRRANCCRPVAGSVAVLSSGRGITNIVFGPNCGQFSVNGSAVSAQECL